MHWYMVLRLWVPNSNKGKSVSGLPLVPWIILIFSLIFYPGTDGCGIKLRPYMNAIFTSLVIFILLDFLSWFTLWGLMLKLLFVKRG